MPAEIEVPVLVGNQKRPKIAGAKNPVPAGAVRVPAEAELPKVILYPDPNCTRAPVKLRALATLILFTFHMIFGRAVDVFEQVIFLITFGVLDPPQVPAPPIV